MLISTKPKNAAEAAVIARSRQLTDFKWTPVRDIPTFKRPATQTVIPAGVEVTGFPYSSTELKDKFFTENISFETFLSAIPNPHSKLYQAGHGAFDACNYGIVCNGLLRYALGIPYRVSTARWHTIPGMRLVKPRCQYTVDEIELCDILYAFGEGRNHVSLITDILRDESGKIVEIEVSEAVRPLCKRESYTPEVFYEKYKLFALWRYDKLNEVPPLDTADDELLFKSGIEKITPRITVDNGNRSNYLVGEEILLSVFSAPADTVEIKKGGEVIRTFTVDGNAHLPLTLPRGYYTASLQKDGACVEFCVNQAEVRHECRDGNITVYANPCDENSKIHYMDFRRDGTTVSALEKYEVLTEEEKESGVITRPIPRDGENFKVYYKNAYGIWTHPMRRIEK